MGPASLTHAGSPHAVTGIDFPAEGLKAARG
jgi:hypothetical protein